MKRRFLRRNIIRGTVQSLRLIKKQRDRHDRSWLISQGKYIEHTKYRYVPYLIKITDLDIGPEAVKRIKELKQIISISNKLENRQNGHVVQVLRKLDNLEGWFNYDIFDTESKARIMCEKLGSKKMTCRYVYVDEKR